MRIAKPFTVIVLLTVASPAMAQPSSRDPYKKLFTAPLPVAAPPQAQLLQPKPKVVCGMTIVPANPSTDPKMAIARKTDGVDYKIRAIDPPTCNPSR